MTTTLVSFIPFFVNDLIYLEKGKTEKTTESYTGGEKSGMAVENPDDIEGVLAKAKENSQKHKDEGTDDKRPDTEVRITVYQNGFVVDDGVDAPSQIVPVAESKEPLLSWRTSMCIVSASESSQFTPSQGKGFVVGPFTTVTSSS